MTMKNNSDVFAQRGNPWVSEREGREQYGRVLREPGQTDPAAAKRAHIVDEMREALGQKPIRDMLTVPRISSTENAELDSFTRAKKAPEHIEKGSERRGSSRDQDSLTQRRLRNILRETSTAMGKAERAAEFTRSIERVIKKGDG